MWSKSCLKLDRLLGVIYRRKCNAVVVFAVVVVVVVGGGGGGLTVLRHVLERSLILSTLFLGKPPGDNLPD